MQDYNAAAWSQESVLRYYDHNRLSTQDIYPSEWFFLKDKLQNGISVLDIGCAKGFMAQILSENINNFSYVGVDISKEMIAAAKKKFPQFRFLQVNETDYSILGQEQFDLVLCIGVLSIHSAWRTILANAWAHTKACLLFDLRETHVASIEDVKTAYFKMDFDNPHTTTTEFHVPYNVINTADAQREIIEICTDANKISHFGYIHPVSHMAVCPVKKVMANVYSIER